MRRLALLVLVFVGAAALTVFVLLGGTLQPEQLAPPKSAAAAGKRVADSVKSSVDKTITGRAAEAAAGTPVPVYSVDHAAGMTVYHNVQYGEAGGQSLLLDAYVPDGGSKLAVVVIHGGGWAYGDKSRLAFEGQNLAKAGIASFVLDYRMAPPGGDWHAPIALDDVRLAVLWVRDHASNYGVTATAVGALGNSAGGNLAMMLGTTGTPGADRVNAVVSYSGQSDLLKLSTHHTIHAATNYIGCSSSDCAAQWIMNSPVDHCDQQTVPMLIVNSTHELMPLDQATIMADKLQSLGIPHELRILNGNEHASAYANIVWPQTIAFFQRYLGGH